MRYAVVLVLSLLFSFSSYGALFTVNDLGDAGDMSIDGTCATLDESCTLRAAIEEANATPGADTITFSIAGVIVAGTPLPAVTQPLTIMGVSAPGYTSTPVVIVDGGDSVDVGLTITASNSQVQALQFRNFTSAGMSISGSGNMLFKNYFGPGNNDGLAVAGTDHMIGSNVDGDGNTVSGNSRNGMTVTGSGHTIADNIIGLTPAGVAEGNGNFGVYLSAATNTRVGGTATSTVNVISGNDFGIELENSSGNTVAGNYVGTSLTGMSAIANTIGVGLDGTALNNIIGTSSIGNIISGNSAEGVAISAFPTGATIQNCIIGLAADGNTALPNETGVYLGGTGNTVGTVGSGNVISGNTLDGVTIHGNNNTIVNNTIGLNAAKTAARPNGASGISITNVSGTAVGSLPNGGNTVSGNANDGIYLTNAPGTVLLGNVIGLLGDGATAAANTVGVNVQGSNNVVIGNASGGNTISGNADMGISVHSSSGVSITGNRIGTTTSGLAAAGNGGNGVDLFASNVAVDSNVISANGADGVYMNLNSGATLTKNIIGRSSDLSTALGNTGRGIYLWNSSGNTVGGSSANANTISGNGGVGVVVAITPTFTGNSNTISFNSIYANSGIGIDLTPTLTADGVTLNDAGDADTGGNNLQNFPVLTGAYTGGGSTTVTGTINTTANSSVDIHAYSNAAADPSGYGEGQTYLGTTTVTTDAGGNAPFSITAAFGTSGFVTATATNASSTSEFSQALAVTILPTVAFSSATYGVTEGVPTVTISVLRTGDLSVASSVDYATSNDTATAGSDYTATSGTLLFGAGEASASFSIPITNDALDENDETVFLTLSNPTMAVLGAPSSATLTIADNDLPPTITIGDVTLTEGTGGSTTFTFTVALSGASGLPVSVDYATAPDTATTGVDYTATSGTLNIPAGATSGTIDVSVTPDALFEPDETFFVNLTTPVNSTITDNQAIGTITNDDVLPSMTIGDASVIEGDAGTTNLVFTISLSASYGLPVNVDFATSDGSATEGFDYTSTSGTATIPAGSTSTTVTVLVDGDTFVEGNEGFFVNLTNPSNATIADSQAIGTITDDDVLPTITIGDASVTEGNAGTTNLIFTISLSASYGLPVTVNYATSDGSATAGFDYASTSGTATIPAGSTSTMVTVLVDGDTFVEGNEGFFVNLTNPSNATIADSQAIGTITDDDVMPAITINDPSVVEGNAGTTNLVFTISLSAPYGAAVNVDYATANGTATAGTDYAATSGTATIAAGSTSTTVTVLVNGDTFVESAETLFVNLTNPVNGTIGDAQGLGTITDDDVLPTITINDPSVAEGNDGATNLVFMISLSAPYGAPVSVDYATANGTATAGTDYVAKSGTATIPAGGIASTITLLVSGDTFVESAETLFVNLTNPVNGTIGDAQGLGTITDDDVLPAIAINDPSVAEGNAGTTNLVFTISLSAPYGAPVTVDYATANGTATAGTDYTATSGTATIAPGDTSTTVTALVTGDALVEGAETLLVNLTNPVNATVADAQGLGTITDDDVLPAITIADVTQGEGNGGAATFTFTIVLSAPYSLPVTVDYATADGTATEGSDYTAASGTATIPAGATTATITVTVTGDNAIEGAETFFVNLTNATNATIADGQAAGTITNDDAAVAAAAVPTMSEWALLALAAALAAFAVRRM